MAKKRVHEIAKEQGLTSKEVIKALTDAGVYVRAASSAVEERDIRRAFPNGAKAPEAPKAKPAAKKAKEADKADQAVAAGQAGDGAAAPASAAKAAKKPAVKPGDGASAPVEAPTPAADPEATRPATQRRAAAPAAKAEPATGPRILDPGTGSSRQQRDGGGQRGPARDGGGGEGGRQRPTRPDDRGAGAGGRRRVVIDSQASRRPQGPPPPQQPPRRRRGRRRLTPLEEPPPAPTEPLVVEQPIVPIASGATVKEVAESLGLSAPDVIKKLMQLGEMATLTQTLSDEAVGVLAEEFGRKIEIVSAADEAEAVEPEAEDSPEDLEERPPVATSMGQRDHGDTRPPGAGRGSSAAGREHA